MKNLIYFSTLFLSVVYMSSCSFLGGGDHDENDEQTLTLEDTISVNTYNTWKQNWKTDGQAYTANTLTEYFTLPLVDITEFMSYPGSGSDSVVAARFVLGLEIDGTDSTAHIMLVGVNSAGQSLTDASRQQYIYDVSRPCPSMCGVNSLPK